VRAATPAAAVSGPVETLADVTESRSAVPPAALTSTASAATSTAATTAVGLTDNLL
jgi:hypothetical protein